MVYFISGNNNIIRMSSFSFLHIFRSCECCKVEHMALHLSHGSQITSSKKLAMETLFRVYNEIGPILVSRFLGKNSLK